MNELTLLIGTCDSYSILWDNFVTLTNKYWKYECDKIFVTEKKDTNYENYSYIQAGNLAWSDRMIYALNSINTEYVFFVLEDYYFTELLSKEEIDLHINFMKSVNANKVMLEYNCPHLTLINYDLDLSGRKICKLAPNSNYLTSLQPSIWKTSHLKSCMKNNWSPWEFEVEGSKELFGKENDTYIIVRDKKPYWNAVRKGLRLSPGWEQIKEKENLKDLNLS